MLTIFGKPHRKGGIGSGVSRRDFLTIGGALFGSLTLPNLLRAGSAGAIHHTHKAVINVYLPGGPPHLDMWDLKPDAPQEIRGEFKPIHTNVPGIDIGELFPRMARMMDKFVVIRSLVGSVHEHDAYQCMTGRSRAPQGDYWPSLGGWVSKVQGPVNKAVPPHLTLMYNCHEPRWGYAGTGGFLGVAHAPFRLAGQKGAATLEDTKSPPPTAEVKNDNMVLKNLTLDQLNDRMALRKAFDSLDRALDTRGVMDGMDAYAEQALGILTSSRLVDALDLSKEPIAAVERYGVNDPKFAPGGAPRMMQNFCLARRLVEVGARVVTLNFSNLDWHGGNEASQFNNFVQGRKDFPLLDRALCALVEDLYERGLDKDVSVVVWGEFGRTPKINEKGGRDHWPQVNTALLAGGGMKTGQVIGATNRLAEHAVQRPVTFQEIFATLYTNLGLDLNQVREFDPNGRPQYLVDPGVRPIGEVL